MQTAGSGPRVLLVHGSGADGPTSWSAQRSLAARFTFVVPTRSGYPPNPPLPRIDFETQARELASLLDGPAHLVGHSYGGLIALLIAAAEPEAVRSLAVSEPPAFAIAEGDRDVDRLRADLEALFTRARNADEHLREFTRLIGIDAEVPSPLPPPLEAATRASMAERPPWEAEIAFDALAAGGFPKLVLSGGHSAAFERLCDVLAERIGAARAVVPGARHAVPRARGYNARLAAFLEAADGRDASHRDEAP